MKPNNIAWHAREINLNSYVDAIKVWPCSGLPIAEVMKFMIESME